MSFQNTSVFNGLNVKDFLFLLDKIRLSKEYNIAESELKNNKEIRKKMSFSFFNNYIESIFNNLNLSIGILNRSLNHGFSGGEQRKMEIVQMIISAPKMVILDEFDSGLDIDALKVVSKVINEFRDDKKAFLIITHYQRLLDLIKPDFIHIMKSGKIIDSGYKGYAKLLEKEGYTAFVK